jgi:hypothetical protein
MTDTQLKHRRSVCRSASNRRWWDLHFPGVRPTCYRNKNYRCFDLEECDSGHCLNFVNCGRCSRCN